MTTIQVGDIMAAPGDLKFGKLPLVRQRDSTLVSAPLMIMNGTKPGPTLWMDAGIHGDELAGIEVIRRIMREILNPATLCGVVVAVPISNPLAFNAGQWGVPMVPSTGNVDAHAVFPGNPQGSLAERVSYNLLRQGMLKCNYVLHFHSNYHPGVEFIPLTVCEDREVLARSLQLAETFGFPVCETRSANGWPTLACQREGKPALVIELLAQGYFIEDSIQRGVQGTLNVLRRLEMIEGKIEPLSGLKVPAGRYGRSFVYSNQGGLIHFSKQAGDWVNKGEEMAIIRDPYGDIIEHVTSPVPGYIRTVLFGPHDEAIYEGGVVASMLDSEPQRRYFED